MARVDLSDPRWVHVEFDQWVYADEVEIEWDEVEGDWGTAVIQGESYEVMYSHDGDGYVQLADNEIDRFQENYRG